MTQSPPTRPPDHPLRLAPTDFDAYLPDRASSNAFNRPRLELKQRMLGWAKTVALRLEELGIFVEVTGSDEHPNLRNARRVDCQRIFFWRDAPARDELGRLIDQKRSLAATLEDPAPHKSHAYLGLKIDPARVEVAIELHPEAWVDLGNVRSRLADPAASLELLTALETLPEQFSLGLANDPSRPAAQRARADVLLALLDRVDQEKIPVWLGWSIPRDLALEHADVLDDQLGDALVALGPAYKLLAWAADNDRIGLEREWELARVERAKAHDEAERDRVAWEARREEERLARVVPERHDERRSPVPVRRPEPAPAPEQPAKVPAPPRAPRPARRPAGVAEVDATVPIERGSWVQVLRGPFEGKVGMVQDLNARGARVLLGLLAIRLELTDLVVSNDTRDRPVLASSPRKPLPARS